MNRQGGASHIVLIACVVAVAVLIASTSLLLRNQLAIQSELTDLRTELGELRENAQKLRQDFDESQSKNPFAQIISIRADNTSTRFTYPTDQMYRVLPGDKGFKSTPIRFTDRESL